MARPRHQGPARLDRRQGDPQGDRPRDPKGEIHALMGPNGSGKSTLDLRADGPPALRGHRGHGHCSRARTSSSWSPTSARAPACSWPSSTRRHPRRDGGELPAHGRQRAPQGRPGRARTTRSRITSSASSCARDGAAQDGPQIRQPLPQRRLLRRREEARRDPADGDARRRSSRSSTRPTPASTSTRCAIVAEGVNTLVADPTWACWSSRTTSASSNYIKPDFVHILVDGRIVRSAARSSRTSSRPGLRLGITAEED